MRLTYKKAGVNISLASRVIKSLKNSIASTFNKNVLTEIGKFGGFYKIYDNKILVASIDGVGTKIKIAEMADDYKVIGEDIVNHCVNDIAVHNAQPLFFLDYIAMEKLKEKAFKQILQGMVKACKQNNVALIGGETAEMPGVYYKKMYDVVGCIVGIVDKKQIIDGNDIKAGDVVIGVASNGLHTNGFSLVNKLFFEIKKYKINQYIKELKSKLKDVLLKPHISYLPLIKKLSPKIKIKGIAHITGGGIKDNLERIIPDNLCAEIYKEKIDILPIFKFIQRVGNITDKEMFKTFNMGIGLILVVPDSVVEKVFLYSKKLPYKAYIIGKIVKTKTSEKVQFL